MGKGKDIHTLSYYHQTLICSGINTNVAACNEQMNCLVIINSDDEPGYNRGSNPLKTATFHEVSKRVIDDENCLSYSLYS